jgi:hypothetical protein
MEGDMAKTLVGNRQTRDHHKQRNSWVVIDIAKAREAVERARRDPKNAAIADHEGKLLDACRQDCVVARLDGAYTEYSARLFASNGGFAKYRQVRMLGQAISRKYLDKRYYAVAESAVFNYWLRQPKLDWNASAARVALYGEYGEKILASLCTSFVPPGEEEYEYQASLPGMRQSEDKEGICGKREKFGRPRSFKPSRLINYRVVDLDDFHNQRRNLVLECIDHGLRPLEVPTEGVLFKRATIASFRARNWRSALEIFRNRVAGEMDLALPFGRFTAVPDSVWQVLIKLPNLPYSLSRDCLLMAARLARKRETKIRKLAEEAEKRLHRFAWLPSWEPGMDDIKQLPLPGTQLLRDVLEFPPRNHTSRLKPLVEGKLPRIVPPKRRGRQMRQQELPNIPRFAIQSSGQVCLCACDRPNPIATPQPVSPQAISNLQLTLRFPRPSSEWTQLALIPGVELAPRRRCFVRRRKRLPMGQTRLPFIV